MQKEDIYNVREFNRFYTSILSLMDKYRLDTKYTILEIRIMLEIDRGVNTANRLLNVLKMDKGYISRVLKKLQKEGLLSEEIDPTDLRIKLLSLTPDGYKTLVDVNKRADNQIEDIFKDVNQTEVDEIISAMKRIQSSLNQE